MIAPYLKQQGLPFPNDPFCPENAEYALLCLEEETWNTIVRHAITEGTYTHTTGDALIDSMERAFEEGADFNDLIKQFE